MSEPKWMEPARSFLGTKEFAGPKHNKDILTWFEESGHGWIKDDETAWCAAFANAMLERVGIKGSGSVAARSFMKWGKKLTTPKPGAIVVFWRGSKNGWQGHVGFFVSESDTHIRVLGGNQSNAVSIANYSKDQLLGYRWPATLRNSRTVKGTLLTTAMGSGVLAEAIPEMVATVQEQQWAMTSGDWISLALGVLIIGGSIYALYARIDEARRQTV